MRVCVYGINYAPEPTGTGKYTAEMAEWLAGRGHEVSVICGLPHYPEWRVDPAYAGIGFSSKSVSGVSVRRVPHYVPSGSRVGARERIRLETSFSLKALRYWFPLVVSRTRPDVVIAVCPPMQCGVYPWLFSVLRRVPWVFHVQDLQVDAASRLGMLSGGLVRVLYQMEAFLLKRATVCSTITQAMARRIEQKGVDAARMWLLPNWSDTETIRPQEPDKAFRAELGIGPDEILVMYAGAMGKKQGLHVVLDASEALSRLTSIRFVLVGAGTERERLELEALRRGLGSVRFLSVQPVERLPGMLAAADIHLVVQKAEAADVVMPSKLTNILSAGRASVATALPGTTLHDVLTQHEAGLVVPPGDAGALALAIERLAADDVRRHRLEVNARRYAEDHLRKDAILGEFEARLLDMVQARQSR